MEQAVSSMLGGEVSFHVPVGVAYAYLADPRNRPQWQSSLRRVELLDEGEPRVGMRWRDHTSVGIVPEMEISAMVPGELWAETGRWRGISAHLMLTFAPVPSGCTVHVAFRVRGRGVLAPVGWLATIAGVLPVLSDVRRAARALDAGRVA